MRWDGDAFDAMYRRDHGAVLLFLARRTTLANAEDLAHETFLTAWRKISAVPQDPVQARVWLCAVARNHLLNQVRGENRRQALALRVAQDVPLAAAGPEDSVTASVDAAAAWQSLRPSDQEIIALTAWDEFTSAQAAQIIPSSRSRGYRRGGVRQPRRSDRGCRIWHRQPDRRLFPQPGRSAGGRFG